MRFCWEDGLHRVAYLLLDCWTWKAFFLILFGVYGCLPNMYIIMFVEQKARKRIVIDSICAVFENKFLKKGLNLE